MTTWSPIAYLPNVSVGDPIEGEILALVSPGDGRVRAICAHLPLLDDLLSRFTDAFGAQQEPAVLIGRSDKLQTIKPEAILSFRDLIAMSVIPYGRSLRTVHRSGNRIAYADLFWIYPWTLSLDLQHLVTATPALSGFHVVSAFHGQSSPELSPVQIRDFDRPLFEALLRRWKRHYFGNRARWADRALFRSLNMAYQAALIPAGVATSILDLGRSIAMWAAAFEILTHPRKGKASAHTVYPLFVKLDYCNKAVGNKRYIYGTKGKSGAQKRGPLTCWICGKLFFARNQFLHGNSVSLKTIDPNKTKNGLFWLAPALYRLGLSAALNLRIEHNLPYWLSHQYDKSQSLRRKREAYECQEICERALLRILT